MIEYRIIRGQSRRTRAAKIHDLDADRTDLAKSATCCSRRRRLAVFSAHGFDWDAIQKAWDEGVKEGEKEAKDEGDYDPDDWIPPMPSFKRGASTISQQLAKNLYLSEDRNFLRKGREAVYTYFLERELSQKTHSRTVSECHRMGRRRLRCRGRVADIFQKVRVRPDPRRSSISFGYDPEPAEYF